MTGLILIPGKTGSRWMLRFTSPVTGKRRDAGLGVYPEVSIADAREKDSAMRRVIDGGSDRSRPAEAEREEGTPARDAVARCTRLTEAARNACVFPSPRAKVVSDMVLTSFLRRVQAQSDTPGRVATAHGFRSSFRDWASEHGYARDLAGRALAHTVANRVEAAYHHTDLMEQRRLMIEAWADACVRYAEFMKLIRALLVTRLIAVWPWSKST
nr:integrase family protein [Paraburkholderia caballeronis]